MKEPLRSRKMNQVIREKKESINLMLSDEKFSAYLIETLTAMKLQREQLQNIN